VSNSLEKDSEMGNKSGEKTGERFATHHTRLVTPLSKEKDSTASLPPAE
jgi:hypothetical protein